MAALGLVGVLAAAPVRGNEETVTRDLCPSNGCSYSAQAVSYGSMLAPAEGSPLNPENRVARLSEAYSVAETRLDLDVEADGFVVALQPRAYYEAWSGGEAAGEHLEAKLIQGFAQTPLFESLVLSGGRQRLGWGPSNFRSPSNPYYFDAGRTNPIPELAGLDVAKLLFVPDTSVSVMGGFVFSSSHLLGTPDLYRDTAFVKADYRGEDYVLSVNLARRSGESVFAGAYGQYTLDEATLVYAEAGASRRRNELVPLASPGAPFAVREESARRGTGLLGAAYTFESGHTVFAEYLYYGHGFSREAESLYFRRAAEEPGLALQFAPPLLGRHYLHLRWQNNPAQDFYWQVMLTSYLQDESAQYSAYAEWSAMNRVSLFGLAAINAGPSNGEARALLDHVGTLGLKAYVF